MMRALPIILALLALAACATAPQPMLPPLAQVEVPVIEHRTIPPPRPDPIILVGKTEEDIRAYLGEPALTRSEAPGEIWRYGDENCGIHLFFYKKDGVMEVEHVETRLDHKNGLREADCLDRLRRQAQTSADGD